MQEKEKTKAKKNEKDQIKSKGRVIVPYLKGTTEKLIKSKKDMEYDRQ